MNLLFLNYGPSSVVRASGERASDGRRLITALGVDSAHLLRFIGLTTYVLDERIVEFL